MNYYKASKVGIVITPSKITKKAKESKLLARSFRSIYRFFGITIVSLLSIFSLFLTTSESSFLTPIKSWYSEFKLPIEITGTGLPNTIDESFYLAKTKIDTVMSNPNAGSGTPYLDPYTNVLEFTINDFIITMLVIAGIGIALSLPLFITAYKHSKKYP